MLWFGWRGRIRTFDLLIQSQAPYRLATRQWSGRDDTAYAGGTANAAPLTARLAVLAGLAEHVVPGIDFAVAGRIVPLAGPVVDLRAVGSDALVVRMDTARDGLGLALGTLTDEGTWIEPFGALRVIEWVGAAVVACHARKAPWGVALTRIVDVGGGRPWNGSGPCRCSHVSDLSRGWIDLTTTECNDTPPGGSVVDALEVRDERATIRVEDTGIGIDEGDRERLFERLHRGARARAMQPSGTGSGLAIAHWIVESHAGTIELTDREAGGTVSTVTFPVRSP